MKFSLLSSIASLALASVALGGMASVHVSQTQQVGVATVSAVDLGLNGGEFASACSVLAGGTRDADQRNAWGSDLPSPGAVALVAVAGVLVSRRVR